MATLRAASTNGTIKLNPISGILTRPNTYLPKGGQRGALENKVRKMTYLTGQQASECNANHGVPPSKEYKGHP